MFNEKATSTDNVSAGLVARTGADFGARAGGVFHVECLDKDGKIGSEGGFADPAFFR